MIVKNVIEQLETASRPVAKIIKYNECFKAIVIGLKKGMIWNEHKATMPTRLIVSDGTVVYKEGDNAIVLNKHQDMEIPVNIIHALEAKEDSICFLIQG